MTRHRIIGSVLAASAALVVLGFAAVAVGVPKAAAPEFGSQADPVTAADGDLSEPVSPFSDVPAVSGLDADLRNALRQAARDAADENIEVTVTSGWRSADYQAVLLEDAVEKYGGMEKARRWVATPETSAHVTGEAVDVGPTDAAYWMSRYGSRYGLCQTYTNEIWHYELATEPGGECPPQLGDATEE
ncbi:M15 family metallopeptidase [Streptomonospora litoralis]|uniref:D-alanyl-D-alanine carboxypeptidase n=1 Tax=Streptomonospora litoralis TaxID=2498135 RepID=A0A4P6Q7C6_9ACTN|nr:M15 family metallopeptidase [Streptomonospora litoralis]QBI56603.1 D-alanyl-D-alanine carboxypeptidase [Streptomonospora litoralis]